jgi:hypothetical protein
MNPPPTTLQDEVRNRWDAFLRRKTFLLAGGNLGIVSPDFSIRFPPLTEAVAALLYIDTVSIFDSSTETQLGEKVFKQLGDLYSRIEALREKLMDPDTCHKLRKRRNELGHDAKGTVEPAELDEAVGVVQAQLEKWGIVGPMPAYKFHAEQPKARNSGQAGIIAVWDDKVSVKLGDDEVLRFTSTRSLHADNG